MTDMVWDQELKHKFNNATYYVRASCRDRTLYVEVEQEDSGHKWKNQFIHSYIEEMTTKTGNFKTFDKFCRMIYSALQSNDNGSVFIDLLTYQDLEILKARKAAKAGNETQSLNVTHRTKNKRYLILTYVVEFDRVHYPLALKLDEHSVDNQSVSSNAKSRKQLQQNVSSMNTARKLLSHASSPSSTASSSSIASSYTRSSKRKRHCQSTPHINGNDTSNITKQCITSPPQQQIQNNSSTNKLNVEDILAENVKLKRMLQQEKKTKDYPSEKLTDIIGVLEDEIHDLKKELERKNLEIRRITRSTKQYEQKHISKRLDDMEDEIERLSTELLSERTKNRRMTRDFNADKKEFMKKIEMLEASNEHYQRKCRSLKNELSTSKKNLDELRRKASKQRLYGSTSTSTSASLRRSRSRNNNKYYVNPRKKERKTMKTRTNTRVYNRKRTHSNSKRKYKRSSSAPRFVNKQRHQNRSRSPSVRFDPTEWAKKRKDKIERSRMLKNTFGNSRSPSPSFRRNSRSVSPATRLNGARKRSKNRNRMNRSNDFTKKRDRSSSRKRNSFGTTISISPKHRKRKRKNQRLPLANNYASSSTGNDENDLNILNTMQNRQKRILDINQNDSYRNNDQDDDDDDDDESSFNPT
eukprot:79409_1